MKTARLLLIALCTLPACDKLQQRLKRAAAKPAAADAPAAVSGEHVRDLAAADYESFTKQPGKLAIIDFHAHWCGPCRNLSPILEKIAAEHAGTVVIGKINVDDHGDLATQEGVRGIPDVRLFRDGKQVDRFVGLPAENEVRTLIEKHASGLSATAAPPAGEEEAKPAAPTIQPMQKDWLPSGMQRR